MKTERPVISSRYVQAALDSLLYSTTAQSPNPLWALTLVDEFLVDSDFPLSIQERESALHHILVDLISDEFTARRAARELSPPVASVTISEAIEALEMDAKQDAKLLAGWSILFHRYVCADTELTLAHLREALHIDERTVRRYQAQAVRHLTKTLENAEWKAQLRSHELRLMNQLPSAKSIRLFGREHEFEQVDYYLKTGARPHVFVTGVSGIGKSVFIQEVVRRLIGSETVDQVFWITRPSSPQMIYDQFVETVLSGRRSILPRDYLSRFCVAVIIDGLEEIENSDTLQALLQDFSAAFTFLIHDRYIPIATPHLRLRLQSLSENDTCALVMSAIEPDSHEARLRSELCRTIWEQVGGHPLAAQMLARTEFVTTVGGEGHELLTNIYGGIFSTISAELRATWWTFALLPPDEVSLDTIKALWPRYVSDRLFDELARNHLIEKTKLRPPCGRLATAARRYLQEQAIHHPASIELVNDLIIDLDRQLEAGYPIAVSVVEYLLQEDWPELPTALHRRWMRVAWQAGIPIGHCARWRPLLEKAVRQTETIDFDLEIAYGVCLRRLSEWTEAQRALHHTAVEAGRLGAFLDQAWSFLELSILARYRGHYARCMILLAQAESAASRFDDEQLMRSTLMERAQIAIDQKDAVSALEYLNGLPVTVRVLALQGEAWTLTGDIARGRRLIEQALGVGGSEDLLTQGRLYSALGRTYEQEGSLDSARYYFMLALNHASAAGDLFSVARAKSNLGAVVMIFDELDEAERLLTSAEQTQHLLGDRAGLEVTLHNLQILYVRRTERR